MAASCRRHSQIFNFMDNLIVHVVKAGRTKMAQVDAGTYQPADSRSAADRALQDEKGHLREDYYAGIITPRALLRNFAISFAHPAVQKALNKWKAPPDLPVEPEDATPDGSDADDPPAGSDVEDSIPLEPEVHVEEEEGKLFLIHNL